MTRAPDVIALIEAAYDVVMPEAEWFQAVTNRFHAVLKPDDGLIGVQVALSGRTMRYTHLVGAGAMSEDYLSRMRVIAELHDKKRAGVADAVELAMAAVYERMLAKGLAEPATHLLYSEYDQAAPSRSYNLGAKNHDTFALIRRHLDGNGVTGFTGVFMHPRTLSAAERAMYLMVDAHIRSALRLRRRLGSGGTKSTDAVVSAGGTLLDAQGDASTIVARSKLVEAVRAIDRAKTRALGRGPEALEVWKGLVDGRWSLVEQIEADGKRLFVAFRNEEHVRDPRGLTNTEMRVVGLVARGYPDKLVAYNLGLASATVAVHLSNALAKLRMSRSEIVRVLGPSYPQPRFPGPDSGD